MIKKDKAWGPSLKDNLHGKTMKEVLSRFLIRKDVGDIT